MDRDHQQTSSPVERPRSPRSVDSLAQAALDATGIDADYQLHETPPLGLMDISVAPDVEERLNWPAFRAVVEVWIDPGVQPHPRILHRLSESLVGRHSSSWFVEPDYVRIHFSVGDWEVGAVDMVPEFAASLATLLGATERQPQSALVPIDHAAAKARARELGMFP